jgi:tetratricopeptide (TPR) repeat protein
MQRAAAVLVGLLCTGTLAAQQATPPDPRAALAARLAAGDSAWTREDHPAAFAAYDAIVRVDSSYNTRALYRVGLLHAWADRFTPATAALRLYVRLENDPEGRIALGRTYAWAGRYGQSIAQYDTVLAATPEARDAVIGRATALAWSGRIPQAEAALTPWIAAHPTDAEALISLGQFRQWRGAAWSADEAYRRALAVAPPLSATAAQVTRLREELKPELRPSALSRVVSALDSEENGMSDLEVQGGILSKGEVRFTAVARLREVTDAANRSVTIPGAHGVTQWTHPASQWTLRAEAGVVSYPAGVADAALQGRGALRATGRVVPRLRLSAGVGREPFDDVVTMARRALMFSSADVDLAYTLRPKISLGLASSFGEVGGAGVSAQRIVGLGAIRWTPIPAATFALQHREASWDRPQFGVFFSPQRWTTTEVNASWERPVTVGLLFGGELALGSQGIRFEGDPELARSMAPRAGMRAGWRVAPGREILAGLLYANVAGAGAVTASDYRYGAFTLTGRWTF